MRIGIFAKTFVGETPELVMAAARGAGYSCVQYNMACSGLGALPQRVSFSAAKDVRAGEMAVSAVSATYNMIHPDFEMRLAGRAAFGAIAGRAHTMGTKLVTLCTGSMDAVDQWRHHRDNASPQAWATMCGEFETLIQIAENEDIYLGIEPELANVVSTCEKARKLIDDLKSDRLRIVFDAANVFEVVTNNERKRIIEGGIDLLADRIALAHAKDREADGSFATVGKGVIDFAHYVGCLKRAGFDGDLITHGLRTDEASGVAKFLEALI